MQLLIVPYSSFSATLQGYDYGYTRRMKTAISIPDDLFDSAEGTARRLGLSRSELYARALRDYLAEHGSEGITERLNEVYGESRQQESGLDPALAGLQRRSLERADERGEGW